MSNYINFLNWLEKVKKAQVNEFDGRDGSNNASIKYINLFIENFNKNKDLEGKRALVNTFLTNLLSLVNSKSIQTVTLEDIQLWQDMIKNDSFFKLSEPLFNLSGKHAQVTASDMTSSRLLDEKRNDRAIFKLAGTAGIAGLINIIMDSVSGWMARYFNGLSTPKTREISIEQQAPPAVEKAYIVEGSRFKF